MIKALCAELGLVHRVDPMERGPLYGEIKYFRLHGGPGYQHRYSEEELKHLKDGIGDKETYVLFNNINMYHDALTFARLMKGDEGGCQAYHRPGQGNQGYPGECGQHRRRGAKHRNLGQRDSRGEEDINDAFA